MRRQRLLVLMPLILLAIILLIVSVSCNGRQSGEEEPEPEAPAVSVLAPVEPAPEPEPAPELEPAPEPEPVFVNPLTGEETQRDVSRDRPIAIMLNNLKKALPQLGVSKADVIYELPAEGGITRMMALFQDVEGAGELGSVRSARDYYVSIARGHDAIFLHAGGSPQAYSAINSLGVTSLDCVNGPYEGTLFWRDAGRRKSMGLEHSVLTSGERILELLPTYQKLRTRHDGGYQVGWTFSAADAPEEGGTAATVTVKFSDYKTGVFTYQPDTGLYLVREYGAPYVDGNTGEQVAVKNVLILVTEAAAISGDEAGRLRVRTTGTGTGFAAWGGKFQVLTWSRADAASPFVFQNAGGEPLELGVGGSYINIVGAAASYRLE